MKYLTLIKIQFTKFNIKDKTFFEVIIQIRTVVQHSLMIKTLVWQSWGGDMYLQLVWCIQNSYYQTSNTLQREKRQLSNFIDIFKSTLRLTELQNFCDEDYNEYKKGPSAQCYTGLSFIWRFNQSPMWFFKFLCLWRTT